MNGKIAIVGYSGIFPGNKDASGFWDSLLEGEVLSGRPTEREFGKAVDKFYHPEKNTEDKSYCLSGAFVRDFEFDAEGYAIEASVLESLDEIYHWTLHATKTALQHADYWNKKNILEGCGLVVGNLSFPTKTSRRILNGLYANIIEAGLSRSGGGQLPRLRAGDKDNVYNAFSGEHLSLLTAQAIGLGGRHFSMDAACASTLYAIRLAADYLNSGKTDMMIAGAVSCADPLFVNMGFSYFHAFPSEGGRSRPLDESSSGLTPAEGAGFVVLKRYEDAVKDGDTIHAVIHGVGLSNDGKGKFLLSPNSKGQVASFERAYANSGISPGEVAYVECHATGTSLGDATELESLRTFFGEDQMPLIGAVKSNAGHMLTAAGIPAIVKAIGGLKSKVIPGTPGIEKPLGSSKKIFSDNRSWPDAPSVAAISTFGFGGTNAHMVMSAPGVGIRFEAWTPRNNNFRVAVTGVDLHFGNITSFEEFEKVVAEDGVVRYPVPAKRWQGIENEADLLKGNGTHAAPEGAYVAEFELDLLRYKIPPKEADKILAQQLLLMKVADGAIKNAGLQPGMNIGVVVAMQPEVAIHKYTGRWDLNWQMPEGLQEMGVSADRVSEIEQRTKDFLHKLNASDQSMNVHTGFIGNLMACRVSSLWDFSGPSFTVTSGEESFAKALEVACLMTNNGLCDGVVVAAVDMAGGFEHVLLRNKYGKGEQFPGEGGAAFVLQPEQSSRSAWAYVDDICVDDNSLSPLEKKISSVAEKINAVVKQPNGLAYVELAGGTMADRESVAHITNAFGVEDSGSVTKNIGNTCAASGAASFAKALAMINSDRARFESHPLVIASANRTANAFCSIVLSSGGITGSFGDRVQENKKGMKQRISIGGIQFNEAFPMVSGKAKNDNMELTIAPQHAATTQKIASAAEDTFTFEEACAGKLPVHKKSIGNIVWNEKDLLEFASGSIAKVFGDQFKIVDTYTRKVRLPLPPYLLVSRVTDINATVGQFKPSTITTEYDIPYNSWYSVDGQAPWAVSVESGQCDLMLISYLGIDFENKGERIYRLLDCTLTFLDELPKEGQTLRYEIKINSYVRNGGNLLFFFSYDCFIEDKLVLKMTNGCAGFFNDEELELGQGVVRTPKEIEIRSKIKKRKFIPVKNTAKRAYSRQDLLALVAGKPEVCFGTAYGHQWRNPSLRLPSEQLLMLDRVVDVDPNGGAWGLGYIVAEKDLHPDHWYFPCHFKDDEVLAGSLQAEGGGQLLQFFMLYLGMHGLVKDARFQPVNGLPQKVRCRRQVTPKNTKLTYRMEVKEIGLLPTPYVITDVEIVTEDGIVAVHFENLGLCLKEKDPKHLVTAKRELSAPPFINEEQIGNFALGSLVKIFGNDFEVFEDRVLSRQPNTDLQLTSRVISFHGQRHTFTGKPWLISEYDVPFEPWYYKENSYPTVPYSVLMEIALQPCGVLTAYLGSAFIYPDKDVFFRNLDGEGTLTRNIDLRGKTISHKAVLTASTAYEGNIIQKFTFQMFCEGEEFYTGTAAFGFFPKSSLVNQVGLDRGEVIPAWYTTSTMEKKSILLNSPAGKALYEPRDGKQHFCLSAPQLNFLDKLVYVKAGGKYGKGYVHGMKKIDPSDWFYNCHFYQDPVMPGSLGIEAMLQSMQAFCILENLGRDLSNPYFTQADAHNSVWKYRGQIIPENRAMSLEMHIKEVVKRDDCLVVIGDGSLWKEDIRIYEVQNMSVCIRNEQ